MTQETGKWVLQVAPLVLLIGVLLSAVGLALWWPDTSLSPVPTSDPLAARKSALDAKAANMEAEAEKALGKKDSPPPPAASPVHATVASRGGENRWYSS